LTSRPGAEPAERQNATGGRTRLRPVAGLPDKASYDVASEQRLGGFQSRRPARLSRRSGFL